MMPTVFQTDRDGIQVSFRLSRPVSVHPGPVIPTLHTIFQVFQLGFVQPSIDFPFSPNFISHQLRNLTEVWIHQILQSSSMLSSSACIWERRVRAVIQVMGSDGGGTVRGRSTDDRQIIVKGNPPGPLTTFVEVIGIADGNLSIRAEIWFNFGDTLDTYKL